MCHQLREKKNKAHTERNAVKQLKMKEKKQKMIYAINEILTCAVSV